MPRTSRRLRPREYALVVAGAVAECEITGFQMRLAAILAADAFAFQLQMQKEQRTARACHVRARVLHDLRLGVDVGEHHVADHRARYRAVECAYVHQFGH